MTPPPRLAEWLLRRLLNRDNRDFILGDLAEQYQQLLERTGPYTARRWYWRQVWETVRPSHRERVSRATPADSVSPPAPSTRRPWFESIRQDAWQALRQIGRAPAFTIAVVGTLALGIGSNTAIFSVIYATLLQPLPYPDPDRLVYIEAQLDQADVAESHLSTPALAAIRERIADLEVSAISETVDLPFTTGEGSETVVISRSTWNLFNVLGVPAALGQTFRERDGFPLDSGEIRPYPLVLSHAFWQRRFGGDSTVISRAVQINGSPAYIVAVMPEGFEVLLPPISNIGSDIDVWWPHQFAYTSTNSEAQWARVVGRTRRPAQSGPLNAALRDLSRELRAEDPYYQRVGMSLEAQPLHDGVVGPVRTTLLLFLGAVGFVLLTACANVANLLLVRGTGRRREFAVRAALGANRSRIIRQMLTESAMLSVAGVGVGIGIAAMGIAVLKGMAPPDLPRLDAVGMHPWVLGFSVGLAVIATLVYGLVPALQSSDTTGLGQRDTTASRSQRRMQSTLAVTQVALSIVLLGGATLMARSFRELQVYPLGFEPHNLITLRTNIIPACDRTSSTRPCRLRTEDLIYERIAALPGVSSVGGGFPLPMNGVYDRVAQYTPNALRDDGSARRDAFFRTVSPTFLEAMDVELLAGRPFERRDNDTTRSVVIVDRVLAEREWPGENPVGETIALYGWGFDQPEPYEVIGIAEYVPQWNHRDNRPTIYVPRARYLSIELSLAIRTATDPAGVLPAVRRELLAIDPDLPIAVVPMADLVARAMAPTRFVLTLLAVFSGMALVLASVGLYGVLAFGVRQRTREIGVRMAFGADGGNVVRSVIKQGVTLAVVGAGFGIVGSLALASVLEQHLFQVAPRDPVSMTVTVVTVLLVAVGASWIPAWRAARVDPMAALRME